MTSGPPKKKEPPESPVKSLQYDLFSHFLTNDDDMEMSNTIEVWESIPKYFFTSRQVNELRTENGLAEPYRWSYIFNDVKCAVKFQPALVEQKGGGYKAFFPTVTEELVEEALKKILANQRYGLHSPQNAETWVRFSLSLLQRELKEIGRERNRNEIKHAIEVMAGCILTLYKEGKEVWKGSILQDLVTVGRDDYIAAPNVQHVARLPLFISHAIDNLEYRQFNYERLMSCNYQLTRWIYKKFIHRYRQADYLNDYHFMYSGLKQWSGLLQRGREVDNRGKVLASFEELVRRKVLLSYEVDEKKHGTKITDVKYTVRPTPEFVSEQKAANKRAHDNNERALPPGGTRHSSQIHRR